MSLKAHVTSRTEDTSHCTADLAGKTSSVAPFETHKNGLYLLLIVELKEILPGPAISARRLFHDLVGGNRPPFEPSFDWWLKPIVTRRLSLQELMQSSEECCCMNGVHTILAQLLLKPRKAEIVETRHRCVMSQTPSSFKISPLGDTLSVLFGSSKQSKDILRGKICAWDEKQGDNRRKQDPESDRNSHRNQELCLN